MKALVIYESMFGNTKHVAEEIAGALAGSMEVELAEVGVAPTETAGYRLVVIGGPTHAFGMSRPTTREGAADRTADGHAEIISQGIGVREWLDQVVVPPEGTAAAAFDTSARIAGFRAGSAAKGEAKGLEARGFRLLAKPEQFDVGGMEGPLKPGELDNAREWALSLVEKLKP